ncbi:hypothetical protein CDL12_22825 [Handroanthus impetiginosus]|uniref:DUF761 domain-containing protein n=1 Tax=Handroanthus impetiginosus TaxID=429701 RepID=A0A2G9GH73_9LAMI|nr:hypothetical protein CDL12_22825 [Handroanthus impetiginosus]
MRQKPTKMAKKSSTSGRRAWDILRLALLWVRKGGVFRNRLLINLNVLQKGIKKLRHSNQTPRGALVYGDREFSFDDTPIIHVKMHRPSSLRFKMPQIPCIKPQVDFDYDFEIDDYDVNFVEESCGSIDKVKNVEEEEKEEDEVNEDCDEGIDMRAEEFIAKFYEQLKLQRQISYLQYNEMLNRGSS